MFTIHSGITLKTDALAHACLFIFVSRHHANELESKIKASFFGFVGFLVWINIVFIFIQQYVSYIFNGMCKINLFITIRKSFS